MQYFTDYPYLTVSLLALAVVLALAALLPRQRGGILIGGLLGMPMGLLSYEFIPEYWVPALALPVHFGGYFAFSVDDLLFSFGSGALVWTCFIWRVNGAVRIGAGPLAATLRYLTFGLGGVAIAKFAGQAFVPAQPMLAMFIAVAAMGLALHLHKPWVLRLSWVSCVLYTLIYALSLIAMLRLSPAVSSYWDTPHLPPFDILGLPFYELAWAAAYGLLFPVFQMAVLDADRRQDARMAPRHQADQLPESGA